MGDNAKTSCSVLMLLSLLFIAVLCIVSSINESIKDQPLPPGGTLTIPSSSSSENFIPAKKGPVDAEIKFSMIDLEIKNMDPFEWPDLELIINPDSLLRGYKYTRTKPLQSGGWLRIPFSDFSNDEGRRFNHFEYKVKKITVHVSGYDLPSYGEE